MKDLETSSDGKSEKSSKKKSNARFKLSDTDISLYSFPLSENTSMTSSPECSVDGDSDDFNSSFQKTFRSQSVDRTVKSSLHKLIKLKNSNDHPIEHQRMRERKSMKTKYEKDAIKVSIMSQLPDDIETLKKIQDFLLQSIQ
jgi:hypothetical protein